MGVGGQSTRAGRFTHVKDPVPILQEAGWAPGPVLTGAENLVPTGIRSPDLPGFGLLLHKKFTQIHIFGLKYVLSASSFLRMRLICNATSKCQSTKDYCLLTKKGTNIEGPLSDNLLPLEAIKCDPSNG